MIDDVDIDIKVDWHSVWYSRYMIGTVLDGKGYSKIDRISMNPNTGFLRIHSRKELGRYPLEGFMISVNGSHPSLIVGGHWGQLHFAK